MLHNNRSLNHVKLTYRCQSDYSIERLTAYISYLSGTSCISWTYNYIPRVTASSCVSISKCLVSCSSDWTQIFRQRKLHLARCLILDYLPLLLPSLAGNILREASAISLSHRYLTLRIIHGNHRRSAPNEWIFENCFKYFTVTNSYNSSNLTI